MFYKQIVIEGVDGDVEIARTETGALVTSGNRVLCEVGRNEPAEQRFAKAYEVAKVVCGVVKRSTRLGDHAGAPNATNSMINDVLTEIERVAGC